MPTSTDTIRHHDNTELVFSHICQDFPDYVSEFREPLPKPCRAACAHGPWELYRGSAAFGHAHVGLGTREAAIVLTDWEPGMTGVRAAFLQQYSYGWPDRFHAVEWGGRWVCHLRRSEKKSQLGSGTVSTADK